MLCVCVCERERERERGRESLCERERKGESVCVRERHSVCVYESGMGGGRHRSHPIPPKVQMAERLSSHDGWHQPSQPNLPLWIPLLHRDWLRQVSQLVESGVSTGLDRGHDWLRQGSRLASKGVPTGCTWP